MYYRGLLTIKGSLNLFVRSGVIDEVFTTDENEWMTKSFPKSIIDLIGHTSCNTHLRPYSVNQSRDQLFLQHSIWWYDPANKKVSRLWMMTRTVSVLKPIAIDAVNKYDFTLSYFKNASILIKCHLICFLFSSCNFYSKISFLPPFHG